MDFNILSVIHKGNVGQAAEIMAFFEQEGFSYVQFIPCMDFRSQEPDKPGVYDITPAEYGRFCVKPSIIGITKEIRGFPCVFDNMLAGYTNREAELCIHRAECPTTLILEQNGDAYPCDFLFLRNGKSAMWRHIPLKTF